MSWPLGQVYPNEIGRIVRLAFETWRDLGGDPAFPRDPEPLLPLRLRLAVQDLPGLSCASIAAWVARFGLSMMPAEPDRRLRGCLLAGSGRAFLFLDPGDPPDERRLTVAHELGHFMVEVLEPRQRAGRLLGPAALEVLDGVRPAAFDERLQAALNEVALSVYTHLMPREADGSIGCPRVAAAEILADAFACELLAPRGALAAAVSALASRPQAERRQRVTALLVERFALPRAVAEPYARQLVEELTGGRSVGELLGMHGRLNL
jgi:hypothetical protein